MKNFRYSALAVSVSLWCLSGAVQAGGFGITVQSASGGGNAATGHAMAEDASAMWYNPALMSEVEGNQLNAGVSVLSADLQVQDAGSTGPSFLGSYPIDGSSYAEPAGASATPSMFYKRDVGANKAFGLGINIPFGVGTEYDDDSFTRYEATESSLATVNINPAFSWKLNEKVALGAGINFQYGHAVLAKAIDSSLLCSGIEGAIKGQTAAAGGDPSSVDANCSSIGGLSNQSADTGSSVEASGVAFGANIGGIYKPNSGTTISVGYRSGVKYDLEGDVEFTHNDLLIAAIGNTAPDAVKAGGAAAIAAYSASVLAASGYGNQDANADLDLPASLSVAFARDMTSKLTLHGDVTWTEWSSVPEIRIVFPDTALGDSVTDLQWEDTVRVGLGATYQMNEKTKLRAGVAYDPTPTPSALHRTPRAPRSDSVWFSVGMSHQYNKALSIDASLAYVKPEDTTVNYTSAETALDYTSKANVEATAISAALSLNYRFK